MVQSPRHDAPRGPHTARLHRRQASVRLRNEVDAEYGAAVNALHLPLNRGHAGHALEDPNRQQLY